MSRLIRITYPLNYFHLLIFSFILLLQIQQFVFGGKVKSSTLSYRTDEEFAYHRLGSHLYCRGALVINSLTSGGGNKYVNDLMKLLPDVEFIQVNKKAELEKIPLDQHSLVIINHIIISDFTVTDLIQLKRTTNAKMVLVIHDFFWIALTNPQMHIERGTWLHENETHGGYVTRDSIHPAVCELLRLMDYVVHQTHFSKLEYEKFCPLEKKDALVVVNPADYPIKRENVIFRSVHDHKIRLGILTAFSEYKGKEMIEILQNLYKNYRNYELIWKISGVNIPNYAESMHHFINLVHRLGIHGLLYLSKYGETYSFAITKYLSSQLPVLYNNFGSFRERLNDASNQNQQIYSGIYSFFHNESEYIEFITTYQKGYEVYSVDKQFQRSCQIFENFLDLLIDEGTKLSEQKSIQIYQDKIKHLKIPNRIYPNPFYKQLLLPYYYTKNLFIITSKINVSSIPFSYVNHRSIFTIEQRYEQTLNTIQSIRQYADSSYIVLVDNSVLPPDMVSGLRQRVDVLVNTPSEVLNYYTDQYAYKGFAELAQMIYAYNRLLRVMKVYLFKNVFKITGRYTLTSNFNQAYYDNTPGMVFKREMKLPKMKYYFTCFYKIEPSYFHDYFHLLKKLFMDKDYYIEKNLLNLEEEIPHALNFNFTEAKFLGVKQNIAVWNETSEI
mmetsp:Transcript_25593/g.27931  ORF Transcript_25593/g.27931 Transcript_25593/m.27931 type:complete len:668 (+) Transcript_25593:195-2198(+)